MTHTLISFLGKARKNDGGHYRTAQYNFQGDLKTTQFFGLGLSKVIKAEKLIVLGTTGSMWDVFYEAFAESDQQTDHWLALSESVTKNAVTAEQLAMCASDLSNQLGFPCLLKIIPYGVNEQEQSEILEIMAGDINIKDHVSLDLTHGLRHLPMLGLLSAMYLQTAKQVVIEGLYSGAWELTKDNITPVIRLDGLLKMSDWISALHGFDKTGDIAPFSHLLQKEGMPKETADLLKLAAFHEGTLSITHARKPLKDFAKQTGGILPGMASLFNESLNERISWKDQNSIYLRQREKALFYLQQRDYVRAGALGYEAVITQYLKKNNPTADVENYEVRDEIRKTIESKLSKSECKAYSLLRNIRNSLAHANRPNKGEIQSILSDESLLQQRLTELFTEMLTEN
jgi:CRISPR-associated Csx2 family protein